MCSVRTGGLPAHPLLVSATSASHVQKHVPSERPRSAFTYLVLLFTCRRVCLTSAGWIGLGTDVSGSVRNVLVKCLESVHDLVFRSSFSFLDFPSGRWHKVDHFQVGRGHATVVGREDQGRAWWRRECLACILSSVSLKLNLFAFLSILTLVISSLVFACVSSRCWLARQCGLTIARGGLLHWERRSVFFCLELLVSPSPKALEILEFGSCDVHQQVWACWVLVRVISASKRIPTTQIAHLSSDFESGHGFLVGLNCSASYSSTLALRLSVIPCLKAFKSWAAVAFFTRHPLFVSRVRATSARQVTSRPMSKCRSCSSHDVSCSPFLSLSLVGNFHGEQEVTNLRLGRGEGKSATLGGIRSLCESLSDSVLVLGRPWQDNLSCCVLSEVRNSSGFCSLLMSMTSCENEDHLSPGGPQVLAVGDEVPAVCGARSGLWRLTAVPHQRSDRLGRFNSLPPSSLFPRGCLAGLRGPLSIRQLSFKVVPGESSTVSLVRCRHWSHASTATTTVCLLQVPE